MMLLGVVLCGGRSSRMGRDKAGLAHPRGGTYLDQAIARLSMVADSVVVSGATSATHTCPTVEDPRLYQGPAMGIATTLRYAIDHACAAAFVTPVDMPWVTIEDLKLIQLRWLETRRPTFASSDQLQPLLGIYPQELADELERLALSEQRSLKRWLLQRPIETVALSAAACRNINTPEDYSDA